MSLGQPSYRSFALAQTGQLMNRRGSWTNLGKISQWISHPNGSEIIGQPPVVLARRSA
jgi:hypothetical protein